VKHHSGADADGDAVDRGNNRLLVVHERLQEDNGVSRPRSVVLGRRGLLKVRNIVAAVNTPELPVKIKQRIVASDCAVLIASLIARYFLALAYSLFRTPQ